MKVKQEHQQRSAASGVRRPTTTASFVQLQQSRWEWKLVGMKVKLPGTVWGIYAQNEETREWARVHARKQFEVIVRNVVTADQDSTLGGAPADTVSEEDGSADYLWIVQHNKEEPFTIRAPDLLPHVRGKQRQALLALGAPVPKPDKKTAKAPTSGRMEPSEHIPIKKQEATGVAIDTAVHSAEKTAGDGAAHGASPSDHEKATRRPPTRTRRSRAATARTPTDPTGAEVQCGHGEGQVANERGQMPEKFVCDWASEVAGSSLDAASAAAGEQARFSVSRETKHTHDDWMSLDSGAGGNRRQVNGRVHAAGSEQLVLQDAAGQSFLQDQRVNDPVDVDRGARNLLFVLHVKVCDDTRLNLRVFEGDVPQVLARQIAVRYNLGKEQESFIAQAILSQAEAVERQRNDGIPPASSTLSQFPAGGLDATGRNAHETEKLSPMYSSGGKPFHPLIQEAPTTRVPTDVQQVDQDHRRHTSHRPNGQNGQPGKRHKPDQGGPNTGTGAQGKSCPVSSALTLTNILP